MDFSSIRRKHRTSSSNNSAQKRSKTFSSSNLSCISYNSTSIGRKTLRLTLPEDFGAEVGLDGKVVGLVRSGPAHASGVLQIGDYLRVQENEQQTEEDEGMISLHVTYGVIQVDQRPDCPFVIEIGNRSHTSLGIALADTPGKQIRISSIQPGSLADRCGFLKPGDILTAIHINPNETTPCSPFYTSYQVAQILRKLASRNSSVTLTVLPHQGSSGRNSQAKAKRNYGLQEDDNSSSASTLTMTEDQASFDNDNHNQNTQCILSLCLWKDRFYEDWGFSLVDEEDEAEDRNLNSHGQSPGGIVYQIRHSGPAWTAGLKRGDKILQINERDVSTLESTILVPILASLDDAMNLVILRNQN